VLVPVFSRLQEGFDTADLREASGLLQELGITPDIRRELGVGAG